VDDEPQTTVAWRKLLPVREKPPVIKKEIEEFFEAAPLHVSETLDTESRRVFGWLKKRAAKLIKATDSEERLKKGDVVAMLLKTDGSLLRTLKLGDLLGNNQDKDDKKRLEDIERDIKGTTLVMDARFGGLQNGLLKDEANDTPATADGSAWLAPIDGKPLIRFRILERVSEDDESKDDDWRESRRFGLERSADGEATRWLSIRKWRDTSNTEDDRAEGRPQSLAEHQSETEARIKIIEARIKIIGEQLGLPEEYIRMLCIAARLHDEGKKAARWQRAFRAERDAKKLGVKEPLAKTRVPINQAVLDGYRHEFGSLPYAKDDAEFKELPEALQELTLHLIAAHHGKARPLISTDGCDDGPPSLLEERAREVALRFARLQKRWGPWGLAWWESLLRAADAQVSRDNDKPNSKKKGNG